MTCGHSYYAKIYAVYAGKTAVEGRALGIPRSSKLETYRYM